MTAIQIQSIVFNPGPDDNGLKVTATCYTPSRSDPSGLTLLCAHGVGTRRKDEEQWEPTLEQIFLKAKDTNSQFVLREVWSVDWQNHGEGAIVNETALKERPGVLKAILEWAEAIAAFVKSPHLRDRRIAPIGHSAGASVVSKCRLLATRNFIPRSVPFVGLIVVEPTMCSRDFYREHEEERNSAMMTAIMIVKARRTKWPSRDEAFTYMRKNFIWKGWDPRVLRNYVDYGMKDLPAKEGVVIAVSNEQEIGSYVVKTQLESVDKYRRIAHFVPVHFIFGARHDLVPQESQDSIFDPANNIQTSSIQRVLHAGHMVWLLLTSQPKLSGVGSFFEILQENPDGLAAAISEALAQVSRSQDVPAKL
ncbi:Alpha/beta hydrolase family-domain-containing protein [Mycena latifolia]|nr:Alpha/beta hydrolase family-domain-containing protein [Mycena latifolia]